MNLFPLPLFPEGSLASSVVTTVWVGVVVMSVMNLRFGWVFSGLVVPGYLVPLMIVKPWSAGVVVLETVMTYLTVHALSRLMPKLGLGNSFFGRDRFSAMIMVSALYRVVFDAWLFPRLGSFLQDAYGLNLDFHTNLHSFGLVVICLAANQFWKTGLRRGAMPFAFVIGMTYLIIRFGLMEFTNFNINSLAYLYEDIASSIHAAPKAYIVLITTSLLASRMNLKYGWDFNGIIIPALIALQWYAPFKVLTSLVEALVVLGAGMLVLRLPWFRSMTMEGSRKILLFFSISFIYKLVLGFGLEAFAPEVKISDYYGFGYLLPTLIAIKMHALNKVVHQLRITMQISLTAMVASSVVGYAMTLIPGAWLFQEPEMAAADPVPIRRVEGRIEEAVRRSFIDAHHGLLRTGKDEVDAETLRRFERGLGVLASGLRNASGTADASFNQARALFGTTGYQLDRIGERYLRLSAEPSEGRPFFFIDIQPDSELLVAGPRALSERGTAEAALALFLDHRARALAIGGAAAGQASLMQFRRRTWLQSFQRTFGASGSVQVRRGASSRMFVKRRLPRGLAMERVDETWGRTEVLWEAPPRDGSPLRKSSPSGFCELFISEAELDGFGPAAPATELAEPVDAWLLREDRAFAGELTDLYQPPSIPELMHLDRQILEPLFALTHADMPHRVAALNRQAGLYGYTVDALREGDAWYAVLREPGIPDSAAPQSRRYWGSVTVRIQAEAPAGPPWCIELPGRSADGAVRAFAITQFKQRGARALITAGTHTGGNADGRTVLTHNRNRDSLFNLAHQAFGRSASGDEGLVVLQCRAFVPQPGEPFPEEDIFLATYTENRSKTEINHIFAPLAVSLSEHGISMGYVDEAGATSPYAVGANPQARYMNFTPNGSFGMAWMLPSLRKSFREVSELSPQCKSLRALGFDLEPRPLREVLGGREFAPPLARQDGLKQGVVEFARGGSITGMRKLQTAFPELQFESVYDADTRQLYLVCAQGDGRPVLAANLSDRLLRADRPYTTGAIEDWIDFRAAWLEGAAVR